jgi:hypothetical protein
VSICGHDFLRSYYTPDKNHKSTREGNKMKKLLFGTILLAWVWVILIPTMAELDINIGISLPPPIVFKAPSDVTVMPDTDDVYVVPGIDPHACSSSSL